MKTIKAVASIYMALTAMAPGGAKPDNNSALTAPSPTLRAGTSGSAPVTPSPVLRETIVKAPAAAPVGTVNSFFQIEPEKRSNRRHPLMQPPAVSPSLRKRTSLIHGLYRGTWHILDNAGVPMFFGMDPSIDPSIGRTYSIPSPKLPRQRALEDESKKGAANAAHTDTAQPAPMPVQEIPQKIPQSELDGVALPTPPEDTHAPAP